MRFHLAGRPGAVPNLRLVAFFDELLGSLLTTPVRILHEQDLKRTKVWFYSEINEMIEDFDDGG